MKKVVAAAPAMTRLRVDKTLKMYVGGKFIRCRGLAPPQPGGANFANAIFGDF